jgi:hypothetical protein
MKINIFYLLEEKYNELERFDVFTMSLMFEKFVDIMPGRLVHIY